MVVDKFKTRGEALIDIQSSFICKSADFSSDVDFSFGRNSIFEITNDPTSTARINISILEEYSNIEQVELEGQIEQSNQNQELN